MLFPVPASVLPHDPVYHCVTAPVPAEPPETVKVVDAPAQIVVVPDAPVGAVDSEFTVTVTLVHVVVLHAPEYRTK